MSCRYVFNWSDDTFISSTLFSNAFLFLSREQEIEAKLSAFTVKNC